MWPSLPAIVSQQSDQALEPASFSFWLTDALGRDKIEDIHHRRDRMRRALIWIGTATLVLALAAGAGLMLVSADSYRATIERTVAAETGRTLRIAGPMHFTLDPELAIVMNDVMLANGPGAEGDMVHAGRAIAVVGLGSLLTGDIAISRMTLVEADIALTTLADGTPNWRLQAGEADPLAGVPFSELRMIESIVTLEDGRQLKADDLHLRWPDGDAGLTMQGKVTWQNRSFDIDARLADRAALFAGQAVKLKLAFDSPLARGTLDGEAKPVEPKFEGRVTMTAPSARRLAIFLGTSLPGDRGLGAMSLNSSVRVTPQRIDLHGAKFTLDATTGGGSLDFDRSSGRLSMTGGVSIDALDVASYLTLEEPDTDGATEGWSEAVMDLSSLQTFDGNVQLQARRVTVGGIRLNDMTAMLALKDGVADVEMKSATTYSGLARGHLRVDAREAEPALAVSMQILGFNAQAFFADAADTTAVTGRGDLALDLKSRGVSRKALVADLDGALEMKLTDGMLNGADLSAIARSVLSDGGPSGVGPDDGTNFNAIDLKLQLTDGRARIEDLSVIGPFLRTKVEGAFGLPARTLRVSVQPRGVGGIYGEVDAAASQGFPMPFAATGAWDAPTIVPDWAGLAAMLSAGEVSEADLAALPEARRTWFMEQVKSGTPFPALPDVAGTEETNGFP